MERNFKDFKGQIVEDINGNLYLVIGLILNGFGLDELVLYRDFYDKTKFFTLPKDVFLGEINKKTFPNAIQKYRFSLSNKNLPIIQEELFIKDLPQLEMSDHGKRPKARPWVIVVIALYFIIPMIIYFYLQFKKF